MNSIIQQNLSVVTMIYSYVILVSDALAHM